MNNIFDFVDVSTSVTKPHNIAYIISKVQLVTVIEGDQKALFSIATTPTCRGGR